MLIRLLPNPPHPSVLFNIAFDDLPDGLTLPQTWTTHLSNLMHDELPLPRHQHALDKASFLPCILDEVVFDVPALLVTCRFIDGTIDQWKIDYDGLGAKFLKKLEGVVDDVCISTLEAEREKQREQEREREREWERERERLRLLQRSPSSSVKSGKHKKKRSLLMTIVSGLSSLNSIINLSLPSPTIPALSSSSGPLPSALRRSLSNPSLSFRFAAPPPPNICPRFLRRRARSSLVDAFRLYVLRELNERVPQGGYYVWVLHSLLNDARQSRDELLAREREMEREREREREMERERRRLMGPPPPYQAQAPSSPGSLSLSSAGSGSPIIFGRRRSNLKQSSGPHTETDNFSATTSTEPPISDDEEELESMSFPTHGRDGSDVDETQESDGDTDTTVETDTDGSSIQTPTSEHFTLPLLLNLAPATATQDLPSLIISNHGSNLSNQMQSYIPSRTPADLQIQNLTHLILLHTSHSARTIHEENTRLEALELRGRRRAWLNRALCPNAPKCGNSSSGRIKPNIQEMQIGIGASYDGLGFSVPLRRSMLGIWVTHAEHLEADEIPSVAARVGSRQVDVIMFEEEDAELVGGERFSGFDERNGIESKRYKIAVPSGGAQLFPVSEVEERDEMDELQHLSGTTSKSPDSAEHSDDDDTASIKFGNLELNQYDDLRELQMDLDIVTGVGFDMMDSSDDEDDPDLHFPVHSGRDEVVEGAIPEGGIRVTLDIPRPKALHARSASLFPGQEQRGHQRMFGSLSDEAHPLHQYRLPDALPERCHSPIPQLSPPRAPGLSLVTPGPATPVGPGPSVASISIPQPAHFRPVSPIPPGYTTDIPCMPAGTTAVHPVNPDTNTTFRPPSRAAVRDPEPGLHTILAKGERKSTLRDIRGNEMGELISRVEPIGLRVDDGEEFTLAMDLPSQLLSSRFGSMSFAAMGQTKNFKGRTRGTSRLRSSFSEECLKVVVEDIEGDAAWA